MMTTNTTVVPQPFIWRRLHSLMGLWLVLFLCEHLLTNSQAALWLGDNGRGFVSMVNALHNLPYLEVIELTLLGIPILIHMLWGIKYLFTAKYNHRSKGGAAPHLPLRRNYAYSLQRITSWILLVCLIGHIVKFRFLEYPEKVRLDKEVVYLIEISKDEKLSTIAHRLDVTLYDQEQLSKIEDRTSSVLDTALRQHTLAPKSLLAATPNFGTATLLAVRDTFKSPLYVFLYTIFVLAACFHAANGFWTFLITWGWVLKMAAQRAWISVSVILMAGLIFLGLAAIWGTYIQ